MSESMPKNGSVGVLIPADGPPDYEWYDIANLLARHGATGPRMIVGGVPSDGHHEPEALAALGMPERLAPVAKQLCEQGCSALIWACTSASFVKGLNWSVWQAAELQRLTGVRASSTSLAFRDALIDLGWQQVDLLSTYPQAVSRRLAGFLRDCGVTVDTVHVLDCAYAADSHGLDIVAEVQAFIGRRREDANPVLIPDTAINTLDLVSRLDAVTNVPIITANQVTLWRAMKMVDRCEPIGCLGVLSA